MRRPVIKHIERVPGLSRAMVEDFLVYYRERYPDIQVREPLEIRFQLSAQAYGVPVAGYQTGRLIVIDVHGFNGRRDPLVTLLILAHELRHLRDEVAAERQGIATATRWPTTANEQQANAHAKREVRRWLNRRYVQAVGTIPSRYIPKT